MALCCETATPKVFDTLIHQFIPQFANAAEQLYAENTILKTQFKATIDILSTRKERKKGKRIALKNQLLLTTEEIYKTVAALDEAEKIYQKNKRVRKPKLR